MCVSACNLYSHCCTQLCYEHEREKMRHPPYSLSSTCQLHYYSQTTTSCTHCHHFLLRVPRFPTVSVWLYSLCSNWSSFSRCFLESAQHAPADASHPTCNSGLNFHFHCTKTVQNRVPASILQSAGCCQERHTQNDASRRLELCTEHICARVELGVPRSDWKTPPEAVNGDCGTFKRSIKRARCWLTNKQGRM